MKYNIAIKLTVEMREAKAMIKIRLITDSSANEKNAARNNLSVVPLTISLGGQDYLDDQNLNLPQYLAAMNSNKEAGHTACPGIDEWLTALKGAQKAIIVTMTSALSGTYESALQAKKIYLEKNPQAQILIVDSRSAGPEISIILAGINKMLAKNPRFVDLDQMIAKYRLKTHLLFMLQSLHNLALNGRVSPAVARLAGLLKINLVGTASKEGKLKPLVKTRGEKRAVKEMVKQMQAMNYQGGEVIIDHCENLKAAQALKEKILVLFPAAKISIRPTLGLCSFYVEKGGLMVGFHE